jgi:hypothetical protein
MNQVGLRVFAYALSSLALVLPGSAARAQQPVWKAGAAAVRITPDQPLVLLGYPDRAGPFTSVAEDIWAKALAIEDPQGHKAVIVTADLVGFQAHTTTDPVCERLVKRTGLPRECFLFNASHTHTGPVVSLDPQRAINVGHAAMSEADARRTVAYTHALQDKLTGVVMEALGKLNPTTLSWGSGEVGFPVSRRMPTPDGVIMAPNRDGVVDRTVPVLRVDGADGKLVAVLFGASCHNVAAGGQNVIHGDFAGVAQAAIEEKHPGAVALFLQGCGADANPQPTGSIAIAEAHGKTLAGEVERVLSGNLQGVSGTLSTKLATAKLPLEPLNRETVKPYLSLPNFQARQAAHMQDLLKAGQSLLTLYDAPIAAWRIGDDLTLVALPGEPVAEYVGLLRASVGVRNLWVAGYDNDCFGYLPTAKVVREGGHEAIGITLWAWGKDIDSRVGFFTPEVQDVVLKTATELARK